MDSPLYDVFCTFASFADRLSDGTLMDGNKFAKLCRDCGGESFFPVFCSCPRGILHAKVQRGTSGSQLYCLSLGVQLFQHASVFSLSLTPPSSWLLSFSPTHPPLTPLAVVLDNNLTPTEVDMIFVRSKSKGERRIKYREFVDAVHKMAAAKVRGVLLW